VTPSHQDLARVLGAQFGDAVTPVAPVSDMLALQVAENRFKEVLRYLKTEATPKYQRLDDLTAAGFVIIGITNQSSIGRNLISLQ
jgi:NADH-quinone oxidoreductase subunit B/C/D